MRKNNNIKKSKFALIIGSASSVLGGIGAIIVGLGLCPCVIAPFLSFAGILIFFYGLMKSLSIPLILAGLLFIGMGLYWKNKRTCKVHKKSN